jgi:hypothetical protein
MTPAFLLSFATTAVMLTVAFAASEVGGCALKATVIAGADAVIVIVVEAVLVASVTEVAVMVTVAGFVGGVLGAV